MKKFYLFLFVLLVGVFNAQIINFPDANFKAKLLSITPASNYATNIYGQYTAVDLNNDGEIQQSEAAQIVNLNLSNSISINNIDGINYFTNLKVLNLNSNQITSVSLNIVTLEELIKSKL